MLDDTPSTCSNAGRPAAPTPSRSPPRSPPWATAAASRPCAATCNHCAAAQTTTPRPPTPPTAREATGWLTRHPDSLNDNERAARDAVLARSPALRAARERVSEFAEILTQRRGHELHDWMQRVDTDGAPALRSFATGLERDLDAVTAGLTLPYSSGPVEGTVNRIKMIKRQMFGRANFDLLRKRVLLAT